MGKYKYCLFSVNNYPVGTKEKNNYFVLHFLFSIYVWLFFRVCLYNAKLIYIINVFTGICFCQRICWSILPGFANYFDRFHYQTYNLTTQIYFTLKETKKNIFLNLQKNFNFFLISIYCNLLEAFNAANS